MGPGILLFPRVGTVNFGNIFDPMIASGDLHGKMASGTPRSLDNHLVR